MNDKRLAVAKELGADDVLRGDQCDVPSVIREMTAAAVPMSRWKLSVPPRPIKSAIESVRKGGNVTLVGNVSPTIELPLQSVVTREIWLRGTCGCNGEYPQCIDLMNRGIINVAPLITAKISLADGPNGLTSPRRRS